MLTPTHAVLLVTLLLACTVESTPTTPIYIGVSSSTPVTATWRSGVAATQLGAGATGAGPFDPYGTRTLIAGRNYTFINTSPVDVYLSSEQSVTGTTGGQTPADDSNDLSAAAFSGPSGNWISTNETAVLDTSALSAPALVWVASVADENAGWMMSLIPCAVSVPPLPPVLAAPLDAATVDVGDSLSWAPVADWGVSCPAVAAAAAGGPAESDAWTYQVLIKAGASGPLTPGVDVPGQSGSGVTSWASPSLTLGQASVQPGTTYTWAVVASNGAASAVSASRTFTVAGSIVPPPSPPPAPSNGVLGIHRLLPTVPASSFGYKYFTVAIESPGGTLTIAASPSTLPVPNAPPAGSVKLYINAGNATGPSPPSTPYPTAATAQFVSQQPDAVARQSVAIPLASAPVYYVGVGAASGAATFSLSVTYACPLGSFLAVPTGTRCVSCPRGSALVDPAAASLDGCKCLPGFFGPAGGPCSDCPEGGICVGGTSPQSRSGYFAAASDRGTVFNKCPLPTACLGGPANGVGQCRAGYTGPLCSQCVKGTHYEVSSACYECPDAPLLNILAGLVTLALFLCMTGQLARMYRRFSAVPVAINFVQMIAILPIYQLDWPQYLVLFFNDCSGFNLNPELTAANCEVSMKWRTFWLFKLFLPLGVAAVFAIVYMAARVLYSTCRLAPCATGVKHLGYSRAATRSLVPAYITFLMFMYVSLTGAVFSFFDCTKQPDGSYTLDASADIQCYADEWFELVPAAAIGVFVYAVGIPLVLLVWLSVSSKHLYAVTPHGDFMYAVLGPMYLRYRPEVYWWELVHFARKAALLGWGYFFTTFPLIQTTGALVTSVAFLVLHLAVSPYEYAPSNTLDAGLQACLIVLLVAGLLFPSGVLAEISNLNVVIFVVLAVLFTSALLITLLTFARELYAHHIPVTRDHLDAIDDALSSAEASHFATIQALASGEQAIDLTSSEYYSSSS